MINGSFFEGHIAVPDFFAGAMENWGVVIYRERYLLFDPEVDSFNEKKRIFEVIYHEVAHQWVNKCLIDFG